MALENWSIEENQFYLLLELSPLPMIAREYRPGGAAQKPPAGLQGTY